MFMHVSAGRCDQKLVLKVGIFLMILVFLSYMTGRLDGFAYVCVCV